MSYLHYTGLKIDLPFHLKTLGLTVGALRYHIEMCWDIKWNIRSDVRILHVLNYYSCNVWVTKLATISQLNWFCVLL